MGASLTSKGSDQFGWQPSALLIADPGPATDAIAALIATTGARLLQTRSIADAMDGAVPVRIDLLVLVTAGASLETLATVFDSVARKASDGNTPIVASIDAHQIDIASASILGGDHQLLCNPDSAELFAALESVLWRDCALRFNDATRDSEAARLARLNQEVARIAETLARLTQTEAAFGRPSASVSDRTLGYTVGPAANAGSAATPPVNSISAVEVRQIIRARRLRDQYFSDGLFEDPAWDMLLDLYAADLERSRVSVSSLCIAAAVAPTTALRWIGRMTDTGLFEREPDPFDRRRAYMVLSAKAREGMQSYFQALKGLGNLHSLV